MVGQPCFFDLSVRYAALSAAGDPLERLAAVVDLPSVACGSMCSAGRWLRRSAGAPG